MYNYTPRNFFTANLAPTTSDDLSSSYEPGSRWIRYDGTIYSIYTCVDPARSAAKWMQEYPATVALSDNTPQAVGVSGSAGTGTKASRDDHVHAGSSGAVPSGSLVAYGGTSAPTGWLLCDGSSYLRASYPDLFTAIGTAYGSIDGSHFNVPDMQQRFPLGKAVSGTGSTLGGTGGTIDHVHGSPITSSNDTPPPIGPNAVGGFTQTDANSPHHHTVTLTAQNAPFTVVNWIIKT